MQPTASNDVSAGMRTTAFLLPLLLLLTVTANAQSVKAPAGAELVKTITALDAKMFDAYNRCDLKTFGSMLAEKLEFYHDNGGLTSETREGVLEGVQKYICGKVRREVVSLEVYPLNGYGAVETGVHRFTHPGHDDTEGVGEAKFIQLWQFKDGQWLVTRIISYDHHEAGKS